MIGIVLWSDTAAGKAVIWCEDQGDLAVYSHVGTSGECAICVGDWVSFDVTSTDSLRIARDILILQEPRCPSLAASLGHANQGFAEQAHANQKKIAPALKLVESNPSLCNTDTVEPAAAARGAAKTPKNSAHLRQVSVQPCAPSAAEPRQSITDESKQLATAQAGSVEVSEADERENKVIPIRSAVAG